MFPYSYVTSMPVSTASMPSIYVPRGRRRVMSVEGGVKKKSQRVHQQVQPIITDNQAATVAILNSRISPE